MGLTASHAPQDGITPLTIAVKCGHKEVAKILRTGVEKTLAFRTGLDKTLKCSDCRSAFNFKAGEQVFPDA